MPLYSRPVVSSALWAASVIVAGGVVERADVIRQRLYILIHTPLGSDPLRPLFGTKIDEWADKPLIQAAAKIKNEIADAITIWMPEVKLLGISHKFSDNGGGKVFNRIDFQIRVLWNNTELQVAYSSVRGSSAGAMAAGMQGIVIADCDLPYLRTGRQYAVTFTVYLPGDQVRVYNATGFLTGAEIATQGRVYWNTYGDWGCGKDTVCFFGAPVGAAVRPVSAKIEITTEEIPLELSVVLKPVLGVAFNTPTAPATLGKWDFNVRDTGGGFVHVNTLVSAYLTTNPVKWARYTDWLIGSPANDADEHETFPMTDKKVHYQIPCSGVAGDKLLVWSDLTADDVTQKYKDVANNTAVVAPLLVISHTAQELVHYLLPDITAEVVSATGSLVTVRLTKTHVAIGDGNFVLNGMDWTDDALGGTADPADPGNADKTIVVLSAGTYVFGVKAHYYRPVLDVDYPDSMMQVVIEVG